MDTMTVSQGFALNEVITIRDYQDNVITTYTGSEALSGNVRPGRAVAPLLTLTSPSTGVSWASAGAGTVNVNLTAAQTATIAPGQYLIQVGLADFSADFYEGFLVVFYAAGAAVLPATYNSYDDLLTYCPWITRVQEYVQIAGFAIERGMARSWLDTLIINHFNYQFLSPQIGQPGFMPLAMFPAAINQPPNLWLREQLNLNYLVRRQKVVEACSKKSLYFILRPQLDALNEKQMRLGMWFGADADKMVCALRAEITLGVAYDATKPNNGNEDTWPSLTIDCGRGSLRG